MGSNVSIVNNFDILSEEEVAGSEFVGLKRMMAYRESNDLMYARWILCHEGPNLNGLYFLKKELEEAQYTPIHKPITWNHGSPIIGVITDSILVKPDIYEQDRRWRIECAGVIWKSMFPYHANQIKTKYASGLLKNSMETFYQGFVYVLGSEDNIVLPSDAPYLEAYVGSYYEGTPVYRGILNVIFSGSGVVADPADVDAWFLEVAKKNGSERGCTYCSSMTGTNKEEEEVSEMPDLEDKKEALQEEDMTQEDASQEVEPEETEAKVEASDQEPEQTPEGQESEQEDDEEEAEASVDEAEDAKEEGAEVVDEADGASGESEQDEVEVEVDVTSTVTLEELAALIKTHKTEELPAETTIDESHDVAKLSRLIQELTQTVAKLEQERDRIRQEFDEFVAQVEHEKAERAKDELAESRVADLISSGLSFSEESYKKVFAQVREQSDDEFEEFKKFLLDIKGIGNKEVSTKTTPAERPSNVPTLAAFGGVNLESPARKTLAEDFQKLANSFFAPRKISRKL